MASRRTRIKGIANIPQRRKTSNSTVDTEEKAQLSPELGQKEGEALPLHRGRADPCDYP
jgi:hypothetical protein